MLDVSRHFFTVTEIKHFLDVMAAHKFNVFHWHLVDDHGWRIEIKKYPRLTELGAWRDGIGFGLDPGSSRSYRADGRYGGFFTQEQIREVVAYAAERHITVVPEIEMPGHSMAALSAYPEFSCAGKTENLPSGGGVYRGVYCAGKDETFTFLENILTEVLALCPSQFIHIGGDEVPKDNWKQCPRCQARDADPERLQSYFIQRIEKFLNANGRRLIGWDEILEGGLAPNATVMSWRGNQGGITAATAGHDVVMSPTTHCYFDFYQMKTGQPKAIGGFIPLEKVYEFEPVAPEIPADKRRHVLGGGANLWTEFMPNYGHLQFMAWPRACALAEKLWSPGDTHDFADFRARLVAHKKFLDALGVLYARPLD
jgi:hexosaminidase